jgi:hypothetical protein
MKTIASVLGMLMLLVIAVACPAHGQGRKATLAQQKMCAERAEKFSQHEQESLPGSWAHVSHYDAPTNVCYVLIQSVYHSVDPAEVHLTIYDAFEGTSHGQCIGHMGEGMHPVTPEPNTCYVNNHGHYTDAKSLYDFQQKAYLYFGIAF